MARKPAAKGSNNEVTQEEILKEFYQNHPNEDIHHSEIVGWVTDEYKKRTGKVFADPDRGIRKLQQNGFLIKVAKGVYRYDPEYISNPNLEDFSESVKKQIFERDGYKCVHCGKGKNDGVEIHADHIKPKDKGGKAILENGQTLCASHNFKKKNYGQTETYKKAIIRLYELAQHEDDQPVLKFCREVLAVYDANNINGHIEWKEPSGKKKK